MNDTSRICFGSNNNSKHSFPLKTPLFTKTIFDYPKSSTYDESLHKTLSTPLLNVSHIDNDEGNLVKMKKGHDATYSLHNTNLGIINTKNNLMKNQTSLNDMESLIEKQSLNHDIALNSLSNCTHSVLNENLGFVGQTNSLTTESRWMTANLQKPSHKNALQLELEKIGNNSFCYENNEIEQIVNQDTTTTIADDPNVLIKHSSDPYFDFHLSMVTMIEEEGLQVLYLNIYNMFIIITFAEYFLL